MSVDHPICQSCGMPMEDASLYGTNADQGANADYCVYCYRDGDFTAKVTMEEMVALCVPHMTDALPELTAENATAMMLEFLPQLKRWKE